VLIETFVETPRYTGFPADAWGFVADEASPVLIRKRDPLPRDRAVVARTICPPLHGLDQTGFGVRRGQLSVVVPNARRCQPVV